MTVILGVDPGAKATGLALVRGDRLLDASVLLNPGRASSINLEYLARVSLAVVAMTRAVDRFAIAVEIVQAPNPHVKRGGRNVVTNPGPAIMTGVVLGAVVERAAALDVPVYLVPPGGHGSAVLRTYPPEIVGARETSGKGGQLRHARSAYDIALAARIQVRTGQIG